MAGLIIGIICAVVAGICAITCIGFAIYELISDYISERKVKALLEEYSKFGSISLVGNVNDSLESEKKNRTEFRSGDLYSFIDLYYFNRN